MKKNWLEWTVFGFSAALVSATVAYLAIDGAHATRRIPEVRITLGPPISQKQGFLVPVVAHNDGDETAERLQVEVTLSAGVEKEVSSLELEFLPRRSRREGLVQFSSDPAKGELKARVLGFERP